MKITQKGKSVQLDNDNTTIDNTLELIKYATEVQSRIKEDINSDYVLAKFDQEKDKEAIKEMTNNAYLSKRMVLNITNKKYYKWNKTTKKWEHKELDEETKKKIKNIADEIFDIHMIRLQMKAILNRNKKDNPILSGLMKTNAQNPEAQEIDEETLAKKLKNKLTNQKEEETTT